MNKRTKHSRLTFVANPQPATLAETVRLPYSNDTVTIINICRLMEALFGPNVWLDHSRTYEQRNQALMAWAERHGVGYYAAPREDFSMRGARAAANAQAVATVIVEDMS